MADMLRCLLVGLGRDAVPGLDGDAAAETVRFEELDRHLPLPETLRLVVAPLFCPDFDALELIERLGLAGYRGIMRIVAPKLPNRQVVLRELRSHAARQGMQLELVEPD